MQSHGEYEYESDEKMNMGNQGCQVNSDEKPLGM